MLLMAKIGFQKHGNERTREPLITTKPISGPDFMPHILSLNIYFYKTTNFFDNKQLEKESSINEFENLRLSTETLKKPFQGEMSMN